MDHGSPTRVSLGAGESVFFGETTERLWLADLTGRVGARILIRNGERWETVHEVTDPGALTSFTTDVAHAAISTEGGLQSLTVEESNLRIQPARGLWIAGR